MLEHISSHLLSIWTLSIWR